LKKETHYWILIGIIIVVGFIIRLVLNIQLGDKIPWPDTAYYLENAKSILLGKGYDPNYLRGPLYSYFIAAIFKMFPNDINAIRNIQAFLWIGITLFYYFISWQVFRKRILSIIVTVFLSLHPLLIFISSLILSETLFIFIYSLMLAIVYIYKSNKKISIILIVGIFLGAAYFTRSTAFLVLPFMILWIIFENRKEIHNLIIHSIVFLIGFSIIAIPYITKMHDNLGSWVLSGYGNMFLWQCTVHPLYGFIDNVVENPDDMTNSQLEKVKKYTPIIKKDSNFQEKNSLYKEALLKYIKENPKQYIYKSFRKFLNIFRLTFRTNEKVYNEKSFLIKFGTAMCLGIVYIFFFMGLIALKNNLKGFFPLLTVLISSFIVFTIYHSRIRYTLSIFPIIIVFSSFGIYLVLDFVYKLFDATKSKHIPRSSQK